MNARKFLKLHFSKEMFELFGKKDEIYIDNVVDEWMDDNRNTKWRFDIIQENLPNAKKILDMASGCGNAVFFGLLNGYDVVGIDPEAWKSSLIKLKVMENNYPSEWLNNFFIGRGEGLPFLDDWFDCITSYQTLEHVQSVEKCISEMLRVTKSGGGIHIHCPDYRWLTFEGHYRIPWLPSFPRILARLYLRLIRKPVRGLDAINFTSSAKIISNLKKIGGEMGWDLEIINLNNNYLELLRRNRRNKVGLNLSKAIDFTTKFFYYLFHKEINTNIFIKLKKNQGSGSF